MKKPKKTPRPQIELFAAAVEKTEVLQIEKVVPFETPSKIYGSVDKFLEALHSGFSIGSPKVWKHIEHPSEELIDNYISKFG